VRNLTQREIANLERRHKQNINEIAKHLESRTGIHHSHIRDKLHEIIEKMPLEKRLRVKMHMLRIGLPAFAIMALESNFLSAGGVSAGTVTPEILWTVAVAGALAGFLASKRYERQLHAIEKEHAEKIAGKVGKVI